MKDKSTLELERLSKESLDAFQKLSYAPEPYGSVAEEMFKKISRVLERECYEAILN